MNNRFSFENVNGAFIDVGDYVRDPLDGELRKVKRIEHHSDSGAPCAPEDATDATLWMTDGGVIGANELYDADVYLTSEVE